MDEYEGWLYGMEYEYRYSLSLYTGSWFSLREKGIIAVLLNDENIKIGPL